ncbi:MAG TPA: quinone oxidoreductase, partial [Burkholderiales bacterium]|nr:quinone oxidoreductase [Burkholderiales bacterium]
WESTFDVPKGREREFGELVGNGVYEGGFAGLRSFLSSGKSPAAQVGAVEGKGIVARSFGGPEVLELRNIDAGEVKEGQVLLRQTAIGVNYIDIYIRKGEYRMIEPPAPLGMEAAGVVVETRSTRFAAGDRVAYASPAPGSYVTMRVMDEKDLVLVPDYVSDEQAAALMLKGMTAEYLLHRTHRVKPGDTVLVHAAAGGVGLFLCQWAKALGARVLGTVSSPEKADLAAANGCDSPIITRDYRFAQEVRSKTNGRGADVIYDGLGRAAAAENFAALAPRGHWVQYGQASGAHDKVFPLGEKSATLSSPVLFHYAADHLQEMAGRTFAALRDGILKVETRHRYPLASAAQAHRDLEARRTIGPLLLIP